METSKKKILVILLIILVVGFAGIGFFVLPVGIPLCAVIGLFYGIRKKDRLFIRWSIVALTMGFLFVLYTLLLVKSM